MILFGTSNQNYIDTIELARNTIESTYDYLCDIIEHKAIKNPSNKRTEYKEELVLEKQPCRKSYKTISNAKESENESNVSQIVKLFIAPEVQIKSRFQNYSYRQNRKSNRI